MTESRKETLVRPRTLKDVAAQSTTLEEFGYNLRDWQHEISRLVTSRSELTARVREAPRLLAERFDQGLVADAYLAAYAEWLLEKIDIVPPAWTRQKKRITEESWFADSNHGQLKELTPASFSKRGIYTIPDNVFCAKRGRPSVSKESKRLKAVERQRVYRKRIKALVERARNLVEVDQEGGIEPKQRIE